MPPPLITLVSKPSLETVMKGQNRTGDFRYRFLSTIFVHERR